MNPGRDAGEFPTANFNGGFVPDLSNLPSPSMVPSGHAYGLAAAGGYALGGSYAEGGVSASGAGVRAYHGGSGAGALSGKQAGLFGKPLRVVHVGPDLLRGGAEQWLLDLLRFLDPRRVRILRHVVPQATDVDPA